MVGGATPSRTAMMVATSSGAPAAKACPTMDLGGEIAIFSACAPTWRSPRFGHVVGRGAGAVSVDVVDITGRQARRRSAPASA